MSPRRIYARIGLYGLAICLFPIVATYILLTPPLRVERP